MLTPLDVIFWRKLISLFHGFSFLVAHQVQRGRRTTLAKTRNQISTSDLKRSPGMMTGAFCEHLLTNTELKKNLSYDLMGIANLLYLTSEIVIREVLILN